MELSWSNIIFSKEVFLMFRENKYHRKKFVLFQETELSYISGNGNPKKLLIFQEVTFQAQKIKRNHSEKTSYFLGDRTF